MSTKLFTLMIVGMLSLSGATLMGCEEQPAGPMDSPTGPMEDPAEPLDQPAPGEGTTTQ